jgi:uncharacterized membrane protein YfcA
MLTAIIIGSIVYVILPLLGMGCVLAVVAVMAFQRWYQADNPQEHDAQESLDADHAPSSYHLVGRL